MIDFATVLKGRRQAFDLTQRDLADLMNTSQGYVCELERGVSQPRLPTLQKWADALAFDVVLIDRLSK